MYKRNIEAHLHNHCCCGKVVNISYSEHVSVALGIENLNRMGHIVLWPVRLYNIFPRFLLQARNS